jgi:serine/threonine-protein kinase
VLLVPSLGHAPVRVPVLVGKTVERARTLLRDADLRLGRVTRQFSDERPDGQIVEQAESGQAPYGSAVDVVVSKGPFPVPVPRVTRLTQDEATALLSEAGFQVSATEDYSDDVRAGSVISQDPPKGTELQPGNTVAIVVSLGPPVFTMPDVVGMSREEAVAALQALGAEVRVVLVLPPGTTVVYQEPSAGATVHVGDVVEIYVR